MTNQLFNVALDTGNNSVKGAFEHREFQIPSAYAELQSFNAPDPVTFSSKNEEKDYIADLLNHIDTEITSAAVPDNTRRLVGQAAVSSGLSLIEYNVQNLTGKHGDPLTMVLNLSIIAAAAVQDIFGQTGHLPAEPLSIDVNLATALPINEWKKNGIRDEYKNKYMTGKHVVTLRNFETPIVVNINFVNVSVQMESVSAQYALLGTTPEYAKMRKAIYQQFKDDNPDFKQVTADELFSVDEKIAIDIGEKTTDISLLSDITPNVTISQSINEGYGNTLQQAMANLELRGYAYANRKSLLEEISNETPAFFKQRAHNDAVNQVHSLVGTLANNVANTLSIVLKNAGESMSGLIYVLGGGSSAMKDQLIPQINTVTRTIAGEQGLPIVYVPAEYAQRMNLLGLEVILDLMATSSKE